MVTLLAIVAGVLLLFNIVLVVDLKSAEKRIKDVDERVSWCRSRLDSRTYNHNCRLTALEKFTKRLKSATQGDQ